MSFLNKHDKSHKKNEVMDKVENIISMKNSITDPNGSYTGVPKNPHDKPVQDADDL